MQAVNRLASGVKQDLQGPDISNPHDKQIFLDKH